MPMCNHRHSILCNWDWDHHQCIIYFIVITHMACINSGMTSLPVLRCILTFRSNVIWESFVFVRK